MKGKSLRLPSDGVRGGGVWRNEMLILEMNPNSVSFCEPSSKSSGRFIL